MHTRILSIITAVVVFLSCTARADADQDYTARLTENIKVDFRNLYLDTDRLLPAVLWTATAASLANGSSDREFQEYYQTRIRSDTSDSIARIFRVEGDAFIMAPLLIAADLAVEDKNVSEWASMSMRALIVGAPAGLLIQRAIGGSAPEHGGPEWRPFKDDAGLSGHAFVGAVPLITAARMSNTTGAKAFWYSMSVLPALSRINDNKHYLSQAMLGWELAYLSSAAVFDTEDNRQVTAIIYPGPDRAVILVLTRKF